MNDLYLAPGGQFITINNINLPDINKWADIFKVIGNFISLVDRTNYLKMPFRFKIHPVSTMPRDLNNFNLSYEECCELRVREILDISNRLDKPIVILYSGGIDSTTVLVSFMKYINNSDLKNKIVVAMTTDSINENPTFYYNFIRKKCNIVSSENLTSFISDDIIMVGGELNDQLFGSDILLKMYYYYSEDKFHNQYSREFVTSWFTRFIPIERANFWFDLLDEQIKKVAPCDVITNYDFMWWYNFCFKWQHVYFRMLVTLEQDKQFLINDNFLLNNYQQFFSSIEFQKWSMINKNLKIGSTWKDYKLEAKKFIYDYNHDDVYLKEKIKIGSLVNLYSQRRVSVGITDNYKFLSTIDSDYFYNNNNSFK